ncbi:MAG: ferrous iron transporter B, partial [Planctomycetales bacterium]|nr:ferrous iron transporter B [Planctomycetales bacterium]
MSLLRPQPASPPKLPQLALIGNPNSGKTALFNALTGLRAKTANYPGITVDVRKGAMQLLSLRVELIDLPGLYSLDSLTPEEKVAEAALRGTLAGQPELDAIVLVLDATNIERNLFLASEVLELNLPIVVALNLMDAADEAGISIDVARLEEALKCQIVPVSARTGKGMDELRRAIERLVDGHASVKTEPVGCDVARGCVGCQFAARYDWAEQIANIAIQTPETHGRKTTKIDQYLTQPAIGIIGFLLVMLSVFYLIFSLAGIPMALIEEGFAWISAASDALIQRVSRVPIAWRIGAFVIFFAAFSYALRSMQFKWERARIPIVIVGSGLVALLPLEDFRSLMVDGVIGGVGGVIVFLPQICILFFFISLLEDSGYLARAAFVMERVMRVVGLPG